MKLIIDIPDDEYETLSKLSEKEKVNELSYYERAIANGIPYDPQGDLISREALKKAFEDCTGDCACCIHNRNDCYCGLIDDAQAVEPRPKGEWKTVEGIDGDEYYECSVCGEPWILMEGIPKDNNMNFCPNCGATMKGGEE